MDAIHNQSDFNRYLFAMKDEMDKQIKQFNTRLSCMEKTIKEAVINTGKSLEDKLGLAIENIENKLDNLTAAGFIYQKKAEDISIEVNKIRITYVPISYLNSVITLTS